VKGVLAIAVEAAAALLLLAPAASAATVAPLPPAVKAQLIAKDVWRANCPVPLSGLRVLTVKHWGFDGKTHTGQIVVNAKAAAPLGRVFGQLYKLRYPIRHMRISDMYGPSDARPADGDVTGSFECRQAVPSPCTGGAGTGTWSNHAYGLAVDLNPAENPYVGCGQTRDPTRARYLDRSRLRKGMVTPAVVAAFRSIDWGWGGEWTGATKDYMHFSHNGH
jgi:hypothetical protein